MSKLFRANKYKVGDAFYVTNEHNGIFHRKGILVLLKIVTELKVPTAILYDFLSNRSTHIYFYTIDDLIARKKLELVRTK